MTPIRGIHIDELRKADPVTAPKVTLLQADRAYVDEESHWMANQVARAMQTNTEEMEVADVSLPAFRILENVSNDPDDKRFSPDDQFPALWEQIHATDIMIIASGEHSGFPCSSMVTFMRRLDEKLKEIQRDNESARLFKKALFGVVISGGYRAPIAGALLASAFNRYGLILVSDGVVCWNRNDGDVYKSERLAVRLERLAHQFTDLCPAICR